MKGDGAAATGKARGQELSATTDPQDPATWKLPIEAYMPTKAETRLLSTTRDTLIDECMAKAGYESWTPAPDLPALGGKTLTDWRYGVHDIALAKKRGYKPDATEQQAYDEAMEAGAVDESGADDSALKKCAEAADGQVPTANRAELVQQISGDAFKAASEEPEVVDAFAKWSSCMRAKGHDYAKPMDANDDPRFSDPNNVTKLEIATATADIECRGKHNVTKTWYDAEVTLQQAAIEEHRAELDALRSDNTTAVAKARKITQAK